MSEPQPSTFTDEVFVGVDDFGRTEYHHRPCGKVWYEPQGDHAPNNCPGCGETLFEERG